ncbi:MAG: hypothetical protein MJ119_03040 [Lachnospiraceae bacterium]|nr:hypothetical protein [Lachnospiraceae bacterium]
MIDFENELKKFHPSLEVSDAEDAINKHDLNDMVDIIVGTVQENKKED